MKWYKAIIHSAEVTKDSIRKKEPVWNYSDEEVEKIETYMKAWDGVHVNVIKDPAGKDGYCVIGWPTEEEEKIKEAVWLMEQDPVMGTYTERGAFDSDWESGEYDWPGAVVFGQENVEILEVGRLSRRS